MTTPYVDPNTIHNPSVGSSPPAAWGDAVRDDLEFLARPPGCVVRRGSALVVPNATWTNVGWNGTDLRDTDGFHTGTSGALIVPTGLGGWYSVSGTVGFAPDANGERYLRYTVNDAGDYRIGTYDPVGSGLGTQCNFSRDVLLNAGDALRLSVWQNSGGSLNVASTSTLSLRLVALNP